LKINANQRIDIDFLELAAKIEGYRAALFYTHHDPIREKANRVLISNLPQQAHPLSL
jgi:hypothetical protein